MSPDWLGSPQHLVAGAALSLGAGVFARRRLRLAALWAFLGAVVLTMACEAMVELVEYPLLYSGAVHATAYYDTIADIGLSLAGALLGSGLALLATARRGRGRG